MKTAGVETGRDQETARGKTGPWGSAGSGGSRNIRRRASDGRKTEESARNQAENKKVMTRSGGVEGR